MIKIIFVILNNIQIYIQNYIFSLQTQKKFNDTITTTRCNYIRVNDNCGNHKVQTWHGITALNPNCPPLPLKKRCQSTD